MGCLCFKTLPLLRKPNQNQGYLEKISRPELRPGWKGSLLASKERLCTPITEQQGPTSLHFTYSVIDFLLQQSSKTPEQLTLPFFTTPCNGNINVQSLLLNRLPNKFFTQLSLSTSMQPKMFRLNKLQLSVLCNSFKFACIYQILDYILEEARLGQTGLDQAASSVVQND